MAINFVQPNLAGKAVNLQNVTLISGRTEILKNISLTIECGSHWVLLGGNGAGKTSLLSIISTERFPSTGNAEILGHMMGKVDLRDIRARIGLITARQRIYSGHAATAHNVILTGFSGSALPLWERYGTEQHNKVDELLELFHCAYLRDRHISLLSQGELARVKLARALMADPLLLLLDEPYTGLDMPAREDMLAALDALSLSYPQLSSILVTHFLEEIPKNYHYSALMRDGEIIMSGNIEQVITSENISATFGREFAVQRINERFFAASANSLINEFSLKVNIRK